MENALTQMLIVIVNNVITEQVVQKVAKRLLTIRKRLNSLEPEQT